MGRRDSLPNDEGFVSSFWLAKNFVVPKRGLKTVCYFTDCQEEMPRTTLEKQGNVFIITMKHQDNRFHPELIAELNAHLDTIEATPGPGAVIFTGHDKFFSNGLEPSCFSVEYMQNFQKLLAKVFSCRLPTIAAINGHMFAGGCLLGLCCDFRVMRSDRGFLCMNEIDIGLHLSEGLSSVVESKVSDPMTLRDILLRGKRYNAEEGKALGIIDAVVSQENLISEALNIANSVSGKAGGESFRLIRTTLYRNAIFALTERPVAKL